MIEYTAGTKKGATNVGKLLNSPFALGDVDASYTSDRVIENFVGDNSKTEFQLGWAPVYVGDDAAATARVYVNDTLQTSGVTVTEDGKVTFTTAPANEAAIKVAYVYNNVVIPQASLPTLKAEMKNIPLVAKARRIAIKSMWHKLKI